MDRILSKEDSNRQEREGPFEILNGLRDVCGRMIYRHQKLIHRAKLLSNVANPLGRSPNEAFQGLSASIYN